MPMVFTTNHGTPLFSSQWTPSSTGGYAGTCIFLLILAIISRVIQAYRRVLEVKWHDLAVRRRYVVIAGETAEQRERQLGFGEAEKTEEAVLTTRGVEERVRVLRASRRGIETQPWRLSTDLPRACVFTVQAGVAYLLYASVTSYMCVLSDGVLTVLQYVGRDDTERGILFINTGWSFRGRDGGREIFAFGRWPSLMGNSLS